jgi:hypothetical protein
MAAPAILQTRGKGRAWRVPISFGNALRVLLNNYARHMVLAAIDGIPDHDLERGGTTRQALRRDVMAYFSRTAMESERMSRWR